MANMDLRIETWKKKLLDLGKRNRLINFRDTKRSNLKITFPGMDEIYHRLAVKEESLTFPYIEIEDTEDEEVGAPAAKKKTYGDLGTDCTIQEQQKTLASLRNKGKTAIEEQGVNILYLAFGFLQWRESSDSDRVLLSPIVLVPVKLTLASLTSPFVLSLHEDEVVMNPTLVYKLENEFGITLPDFEEYENDVRGFLKSVSKLVGPNGWDVLYDIELGLLSFLKINMYKDLDRNAEVIKKNPIVKALTGDTSEITTLPSEYNSYDHDQNIKPIDTYQVVDADSSQLDAILYSKKGVSFILQGPPGTGKSQTITNIIAEALAEGKKVLFVSEKMAALEVVHNRLSQAGLSDFCLTLHSHKANKKVILENLGKTLNLNRFRLQREAIDQLEALKVDRDRLNRYSAELHTEVLPLQWSIYEVNGSLAKLQSIPDIVFKIEDVRGTTPEKISHYQRLLNEFTATLGRMHEDFAVNPWRGSSVNGVSHELRHDIETNLQRLIPRIENLTGVVGKTETDFKLDLKTSLATLDDLVEILSTASRSSMIPVEWVDSPDITRLSQQAEEFNRRKTEFETLLADLSTRHHEGYFVLPAGPIAETFHALISKARNLINAATYPDDGEIVNHQQYILAVVVAALEKLETVEQICQEAEGNLGAKAIENLEDAQQITRLFECLLSNPKPALDWYDPERFKVVKRLFRDARKVYEDLDLETRGISARFDGEILDIDSSAMLKRFKTDYNSILKLVKRSYWADKKTIQSFSREVGTKFDDSAIIQVLNELRAISEKKKWIAENDEVLATLLGSNYLKGYTDWPALEKALENFEFILEFYGLQNVSRKARDILSGKSDTAELTLRFAQLKSAWESDFIRVLNQTLALHSSAQLVRFTLLLEKLKTSRFALEALAGEYSKMRQFYKQDATYQEALIDFMRLKRAQEIEGLINGQSNKLKGEYYFLFQGLDTDWDTVISSLSWTGEFKNIVQKYELPRTFIERICKDNHSVKFASRQLALIEQGQRDIAREWDWFIALFDERDELLDSDLLVLLKRLERCQKNLAALEEWIDFRSSRERCRQAGLADYLEKVESLRIPKDKIVPAFLKRFYRLWLDAVLPEFPAVYSFRRRTQDELVKEFKTLDLGQLQIARARVKEHLVSTLPDINKLSGAVDEVSILKRELNKQRRIMPLRKLFRSIPNLLLTLKPCLMMSPLSVSLFLEAENYQFDLVIFDEASQVRTEDAVGAIMRGKQVVIAGDSKQLPPTNFFTASTSDSDYDLDHEDDEQYDDPNGYESVLDEAVTVLPSRTLLWHYRSRHEHLIAFSNAKIYNQQLITFPSYIDRLPDNGVEFIPVDNGVYDRSGKRNNVNEAKRVAEIVFDQIRKYPKRSLGVVTFSEAQQQAVEAEIRRLRLKSPQYENYFSEDKEEAFFIKNLENVQGDERDTIIFSIGYARDQNGMMHMNFGPLSRSGGFRRLNVAITRAKYNVKLVGSIGPTDIDLEKTSSEGVKMLRSYIEFARRGPEVLQSEITVAETIYTDSPFEEAVYDYLVKSGYKVATQVGCSGYRIDLAVKHPTLSGRYVLGIECDGASYHSARTARERDRLRQTVLEDIGWKIYRIWSTDWIKDPDTEGRKLSDAVKAAVDAYSEENPGGHFGSNNGNKRNTHETLAVEIPIEPITEEAGTEENPYHFDVYIEANVHTVKRRSMDNNAYLADIIRYVVQQEYPIHMDVLYKRILGVMTSQRVTSNVKHFISSVIRDRLSKEIEIRQGFLWPKGVSHVPVRAPGTGGNGRKIEHISTEELAEAMFVIAQKSFGIMQPELYVATARTFGFNRTGGNIAISLELAYDHLLSNGRIRNIAGKVTV